MKIIGLKMEIEFDNVEKMIIRDFLIPEIKRMPLRNENELNGRDKLVGELLAITDGDHNMVLTKEDGYCGILKYAIDTIGHADYSSVTHSYFRLLVDRLKCYLDLF